MLCVQSCGQPWYACEVVLVAYVDTVVTVTVLRRRELITVTVVDIDNTWWVVVTVGVSN